MAAALHSLRVPEALEEEIARELERRGEREWSAGVLEILAEAVRMTRAPGVVFVDGRGSRRAAVAHSGLEVWEMIATWKAGKESWNAFQAAYAELTELQLRSALNYYRLYPDEIDARLARETAWTAERVASELPFTQPTPRDSKARRPRGRGTRKKADRRA